ncbi:hypothetical protein [Arenicella xantha]|uniref:Uncharacterized protein n=1 Tax=Arenicella xantha TaxID=644221 RepID=A0A395JM16_9GAMM|nr:hypothetical protein [Arenicella xantha]RBP52681.1 hypothetical protein DFR28_10163 [Arenicella xantha]
MRNGGLTYLLVLLMCMESAFANVAAFDQCDAGSIESIYQSESLQNDVATDAVLEQAASSDNALIATMDCCVDCSDCACCVHLTLPSIYSNKPITRATQLRLDYHLSVVEIPVVSFLRPPKH